MHAYQINAHRIHKTKNICIECGQPYHWTILQGVSLSVCPACRARIRREREDRNASQNNMVWRKPE